MSDAATAPAPLDTIDYCPTCQEATGQPTITQYDAEICMCCGRVWGFDGDLALCRAKHVEGTIWWVLLDREQGLTVWTYHVVFGDGIDSRVEVGPFGNATEAVTYAASKMGHTVDQVRGGDTPAGQSVEDCDHNTGGEVLVGYTIERYDGVDTDGNWSGINGGVRQYWKSTISIRRLIHVARDLASERGENPEYDRALVELVANVSRNDWANQYADDAAPVYRAILGRDADV